MKPKTIIRTATALAVACSAWLGCGRTQSPPGATVVTASGNHTNRYHNLKAAMNAATNGDTVYPDPGVHIIGAP